MDYQAVDSSARTRLPGPLVAVIAAIIYTAGMAVTWIITTQSYADQTAQLVRSAIPELVILVLLMVALARFTRIPLNGDLRARSPWVWLPVAGVLLMPLSATVFLALNAGATDWGLVGAVLIGTLLVGFGEEIAYRAIGITGLGQRLAIPYAVMVSAVLFGLLHSINGLAGAQNVPGQVLQTAVMGLSFGWVYVLSGRNLPLVAVLHGLYDFGVTAGGIPDAPNQPALGFVAFVGLVVWGAYGLVMLVVGLLKYRTRMLSDI